ncbi:MAG: hypothetical protein NTW94_09710 [Legionellales bacterium]|nr:hypothetical protein [Legionellales bacterium]
MKRLNTWLCVTSLLMMKGMAFASCTDDNPQGPDAVISCAASIAGFASAEEFWNNKLFSPVVIDGYCKKNPPGLTVAQAAIYAQYRDQSIKSSEIPQKTVPRHQ